MCTFVQTNTNNKNLAVMGLTTVTRKQLKELKAIDFKEGDLIDVIDKNDELIYTINISYGEYKTPMKTNVNDKNFNFLNCTPGTKGGWPYYISEFIHAR